MNLGLNLKWVFQYLIPFRIRGTRAIEWVGALLTPVQSLNVVFAAWAGSVRYFLAFNGQVVYLEHVLNDQFDASLRRIYIDDPGGTVIVTTYVHNKIEQQPPLYLYNVADADPNNPIVYNIAEIGTSTDDFVVHVPAGIFSPTVQVQMSVFINQYRIAGKRYSFLTF